MRCLRGLTSPISRGLSRSKQSGARQRCTSSGIKGGGSIMTSRLLVKPSAMSTSGVVHRITPESAGWTYVGFEVLDLQAGTRATRETLDREACLIIMSGRAAVTAGTESYGVLGERTGPFDGSPWSVYVPAKSSWSVQAETDCELAIGWAPAEGRLPPRVIPPSKVGQETRGIGSNTRYVRNILP